jgi:hypothetical protein
MSAAAGQLVSRFRPTLHLYLLLLLVLLLLLLPP